MLGWYIDKLGSLSQFYPDRSALYTFNNFYRGGVSQPGSIIVPTVAQATGFPGTYATLQSVRTTLCQQHNPTCNYLWTPASLSAPGAQNVQTERTYATYVTLHFGSENGRLPLTGNLGVRVVKTETTASGDIVFPTALTIPPTQNPGNYPAFDGATIPESFKKSYTDVLPVLNLTYHLTPTLQARLAVSKGVVRPDFSQTQAYRQLSASIDQTSGVLSLTSNTSTNPNLNPTRAKQVDGSLEWYFAPSGSLTGAVFYKDLRDVIRTGLFNEQFGGLTYAVTSPENIASGRIRGVEAAWQQFFDFLPGWMKGFGASINYTFVDSSSNASGTNLTSNTDAFVSQNGVDTDGTVFGRLPLEGLSKHSFNVAGFFERGPWQMRLAYNWRSRYLLAVNAAGTQGTDGTPLNPNGIQCNTSPHCVAWGLPMWNDDYGQLDGSVFYKITNWISVGLEAQNLNNEENRVLMQQNVPGMHGRGWFISDRRYTAQVRASF
jgi:TonB-dependent receptor